MVAHFTSSSRPVCNLMGISSVVSDYTFQNQATRCWRTLETSWIFSWHPISLLWSWTTQTYVLILLSNGFANQARTWSILWRMFDFIMIFWNDLQSPIALFSVVAQHAQCMNWTTCAHLNARHAELYVKRSPSRIWPVCSFMQVEHARLSLAICTSWIFRSQSLVRCCLTTWRRCFIFEALSTWTTTFTSLQWHFSAIFRVCMVRIMRTILL